jgi:uncharacterized protein (DUF1697 family)
MPVLISMLRGVNLRSDSRIKMDALRGVYESLRLEQPRTYIQSGNVIFRTQQKNRTELGKKIQNAIERVFGCRPEVILRTTAEMKAAIAASPFRGRRNLEPAKLLVTFLAREPGREAEATLTRFKSYPEEVHLKGRELYIYFPSGVGRSKFPWSQVEKLLGVAGTARNWNSVRKMLQMAEEMESAG